MKILITVSTLLEIKNIIKEFDFVKKDENIFQFQFENNFVTILISGVGLVETTYNLAKVIFRNNYDFVLNVGICGSFDKKIKIGTVVNIISEQFGDFGVDDNGIFKTFFDLNFLDKNKYPFENGEILNMSDIEYFKVFKNLETKKSISVNKASGEQKSIENHVNKFSADIENMEGAAFFYVCKKEKIQFAEIRAISNYVEPRNTKNWNIDLAVTNLNITLSKFIKSL